jgi:succinate-semialdehyde dehydrogenase/glutarate-semialdehyde dehydrogenase
VVLSDADLDLAANCIVTSRLNNTGQVCIAAKRIIAVQEIGDALTDKIVKLTKEYQLGDPLDPTTKLGPMAREDLRKGLHQQVLASVKKGATVLLGAEIPKRKGYYYPPTILTNVRPGMPAFDEELFGPVIAIIMAQDEAEAIALANQSQYGLGAAVFTRDLVRGERIATHEIEVGCCFVNGFVASDPRLPFGGIKHSGFGRELAREGILEFVNTKTVVVNE